MEQKNKEIKPIGMKSLTELYKIGRGPSSSHTMGPERACKDFVKRHSDIESVRVFLYGSLAKTGKGHGTDRVIEKTLFPILTDTFYPAMLKWSV